MPDTESGPKHNFYKVLGVSTDATPEEIEAAYFELARKLHPDVADGGEDAQTRFMLINQAYQVLTSEEERKEHDKALGLAPVEDGGAAAGTMFKKATTKGGLTQKLDDRCKKAIRMARHLRKQGDFWQATEVLQKLLADYPRQPALRRALALAAEGKFKYHEAVDHLKVACEVEYFNAENHVLLGRMYMKGKQLERARQAYLEALSWDENNEKAQKGLRRVDEMISGGSLLKKLKRLIMGKKG